MWLQSRLPYCKVYLHMAWTWQFFSLWGMKRTELFQRYEANTHEWCPRWWLNFDGNGIYSNKYVMKYTEILDVNLFAFAYRLFYEDFSSIYGAMGCDEISFFLIYLNGTSFAQLTMSPLIFWGSNFLQLESLLCNTWVRRLFLSSFDVSLPSGSGKQDFE